MDKVLFPVILIGSVWVLLLFLGVDRQTTISLTSTVATVPAIVSVLTGLAVSFFGLRATPSTYRMEKLKRDRYGAWVGTVLLAGLLSAGAGYFVSRGILQVSAQHWSGKVQSLPARVSEVRIYGGKAGCRKRVWVEPALSPPFSVCFRATWRDPIGPDVNVGAEVTLQIKNTILGSVVTALDVRTPGKGQ